MLLQGAYQARINRCLHHVRSRMINFECKTTMLSTMDAGPRTL